jgi:heptaprenyl diphosphate synthase
VTASATRLNGVDFADPVLESAIRAGLARVEDRLQESATSRYPFVTEVARHLMQAGGKRFRPLLVLLAAEFGDRPDAAEVVDSAVVVELTHLATLYHDDVMDEADVRRSAESANSRWTNSVAILTGDFLFAQASEILAELGPEAVRIQARTFSRLVEGQIMETVPAPDGSDPVDYHLAVLTQKTGSLIATCLRFGAMFAGCPPEVVHALIRYGETIGVAFQLSDDILDIASDSVESGKTPGTDLREGIRTLPVLYALASTDPGEARLRDLLAHPLTDDAEHAEALHRLRHSPALKSARGIVERFADQARDDLAALPDIPARAALHSLIDFMIARTG